MAKTQGGDSSLLIGLVLGLVVGAAIAIILTEVARENEPPVLIEKAKDRIEGAAEAAN